jgi:hypothetical protein
VTPEQPIFRQLPGELGSRFERRGQTERLQTLADLNAAALRWREAVAVVLDPGVPGEQVRAVVFDRVAPESWPRQWQILTAWPDDPIIILRPSRSLVSLSSVAAGAASHHRLQAGPGVQ